MPIRSMFFGFDGATGRDIHLIRGDTQNNTSRDIRDFGLFFIETFPDGHEVTKTPSVYFGDLKKLSKPIDVVMEFLPTFKHLDNSVTLENFGIHVDRATGTVLLDAGPIARPFPSNFIIQINATHTPVGAGPFIPPLFIRVHVHDGVDRIWITPKHLTVRRRTKQDAEFSPDRFTVRARFTDGAVGDVTLYHGITWTPAKSFSAGPFSTPDTATNAGLIQFPANFTGPSGQVTATWQVGGGAKTDTADFTVASPWASEVGLPKIDLVSGVPAVWGGASPEPFPNVLFMGAGFTTPADIGVFQSAVKRVSEDWKADFMTRPFDLLATSMNLWSVAVPAVNRGISVRDVVYLPAAKNGAEALPMPRAIKHAGGTAAWNLSNLVFAVGLPLPAYITELRGAGQGPTNGVLAFWAAIANQAIPPAAISPQLIDKWLDLGNVNFIDEIDSFPPVSIGTPPDADPGNRGNFIGFHTDRFDIADLRAFFAAMPSTGGIPVSGGNLGHLWTEDPKNHPAFGFDNRNFVVTLIAGAGEAVQDRGVSIFIPIKRKSHHDVTRVAAGQIQHSPLVPLIEPTPAVYPEFSREVAHELGHGFGLEDEYAELPLPFTAAESTLAGNPNVTSLAAVTNQGKVQSGMIKWNWDRIERAAVLSGPVTGGGGSFTIPLMPGHQLVFKLGDVVRLRQRTRLKPLIRSIDTQVTFAGLQLTFSSLGVNSITVTSATAKPSDFVPFGAGSLLYVPVPIAPANPASPFLRMIAPVVAALMDSSGNPLTGPTAACNPVAEATIGLKDQVPILLDSIFPLMFSRRDTPYVVGLYSGGVRFGCGVFHPTGACMMRNHYRGTSIFCPVCRYALVDAIDPTKHREIDQDYAKKFPD
jgi:hypothetical protein